MGWFKKKEKTGGRKEISQLHELPKLPELPELPEPFEKNKSSKSIHQLPSFPNDSLGEKFSQNTIKEAITGKKEGERVFEADDFESDEDYEERMMPKPVKTPRTKEFSSSKIPQEFKAAARKVKEAEPIFIRIDKFEESLQIFEQTKKQISEIEKMLSNIKKVKEKEEEELEFWEGEIKTAKEQIEKVDEDLFSKIE
ncbi:hypothetical protein KAR52_00045 [Candidatus Pacearchaeota archaeon]|nr:hypothetical protein [Candidatus Pacearchaeota archaeon]MCK5150038.1 hypothetical protein [Candidatus Pacearchaeota archaeon]